MSGNRSGCSQIPTITTFLSRMAKRILPVLVAAVFLITMMAGAYANPTGGTVTTGSGTITQTGKTTTITQATDKLGLNWQNFNIASGERVNFLQPGTGSIVLNRVTGNNASAIYGVLSANGKVFLINPNGILFAPGAQVNVGGLVASSLSLSDSDFMAGKYNFTGYGGSVVNQGTITAADGGYVALLGSQVKNEGIIVAKQGTVALGAGNAITLDMYGDGLLNLAVNEGTLQALAENKNLVQADGGRVVMTARSADTLAGTVVNNSGIIQARSINNVNGVIRLDGGTSGTVSVSGTLDVSGQAAGQTGGTVSVTGQTLALTNSANVNASGDTGGGTILIGGGSQGKDASVQNATTTTLEKGATLTADSVASGNGGKVVVWSDGTTTFGGNISAQGGSVSGNGGNVEVSGKQRLAYTGWTNLLAPKGVTGNLLLDPADYNIAASGGDITGAALSTQLGSANVTILSSYGSSGSNGDINVNDAINWASGNALKLSAYRNVSVNANITNTNTNTTGANVELHADNTGIDAGTVSIASGKTITTNGAVSIYYNPSGSFTATVNGATVTIPKKYFAPTDYSSFVKTTSGGAGAVTAYMLINDMNQLQAMGAYGGVTGNYALGRNIDASSTSAWNGGAGFVPIGQLTGALDGYNFTINKLYIYRPTWTVDYKGAVGLFVFFLNGTTVKNLGVTNANITGAAEAVGGLVGATDAYAVINNCYFTGNVVNLGYSSAASVGGLVGEQWGTITNSYSTGSVSSSSSYVLAGGLVGQNSGSISNSYSTANVAGNRATGGLVGSSFNDPTGNSGWVPSKRPSIDSSYSTGTVNGGSSSSSLAGGLVGWNLNSSITNSYSTSSVVGGGKVGGLAGYNTMGGLSGYNTSGSIINNSYSTGKVSGVSSTTTVGGLVGVNDGGNTITNSYWDTQTSGQSTSAGGTGLTTAQMMQQSSYPASWDFTSSSPAWGIVSGQSYPYLAMQYSSGILPNKLDALAYIASYPDLMNAFGTNTAALAHYMYGGYKEGRTVTFNALSYIASYPDLMNAFGTDTTAATGHYISNGYNEGRRATFNASAYLTKYSDLQAAFGADTTSALIHYISSGYKEGRTN